MKSPLPATMLRDTHLNHIQQKQNIHTTLQEIVDKRDLHHGAY